MRVACTLIFTQYRIITYKSYSWKPRWCWAWFLPLNIWNESLIVVRALKRTGSRGTLCFLGPHSDFARFARFVDFHRLFAVSPRLIATMRLFVFWCFCFRFASLWLFERDRRRLRNASVSFGALRRLSWGDSRFVMGCGLVTLMAWDVLTCWRVDLLTSSVFAISFSGLKWILHAAPERCTWHVADSLWVQNCTSCWLADSGSKHFPGWKHPGVCGLDKATKWSQCGIPQAASRSILDQLSVVPSEKRSRLSGRVELAFSAQKIFEFFVKRTAECSFWCWWFMLVFSQLLPKQNGSARVLGASILGPYRTHWNMSVSDQHLQSAS